MLLPSVLLKKLFYLVHHHKAALVFKPHICGIRGPFGTENVLLMYCFVLYMLAQLQDKTFVGKGTYSSFGSFFHIKFF